MVTSQKQIATPSPSSLTTRQPPLPTPFLYLNLPAELSQKIAIYVIGTIVLLAFLGWFGLSQIQAHNAPPTLKIGLIAPFEGLYRNTGYEVLFATKLALQERNQGQGLHGYRVELVALNDFNDPSEAGKQALALTADLDIVGVVGHMTSATTLAALPIYQEAQLAVSLPWSVEQRAIQSNSIGVVGLAATVEETNNHLQKISQALGVDNPTTLTNHDINISVNHLQAVKLVTDAVTAGEILTRLTDLPANLPRFGQVEVGNLQLVQVAGTAADGFIFVSPAPAANELSGSENFTEAYQLMTGLAPSPMAILAYDATHVLLDAIEQVLATQRGNASPSRADIQAVITQIERKGVSGHIKFDNQGQRLDPPIWTYQITGATYPGTLINP